MPRLLGPINHTLLKDAGVTGGTLRKATKELAEDAEKGSVRLWLRKKDKC